jgi:hypothetical protein
MHLHFCPKVQSMPRQPTDFSLRLPKGWKGNLCAEDAQWVGRSLFQSQGKLAEHLTNWWNPPEQPLNVTVPVPARYFTHRLFLWMPRLMWRVALTCPNCPLQLLRSKGVYNRLRLVLDMSSYYYLAAEYHDCRDCKGTFIAYDSRLLCQLSDGRRSLFPVLLTRKYACDQVVVSLLKSRTLGNSTTALHHNLLELHSEEWLRRALQYLDDCNNHRLGRQSQGLAPLDYAEAPPFKPLPCSQWFLAAYIRDVWTRLDVLKASLTSTLGTILKMDSTKKVCKKLQGEAKGTASWATSVGNERGQVLQCILTTSEANDSLKEFAEGLMTRYARAGASPPVVLYTDRDCCCAGGPSKLQVLFHNWNDLKVRLDIWHFMRRLAVGCTSESHPLYATFMARLPGCIFEWDKDDHSLLMVAKRSELVSAGVPRPTDKHVTAAITKDELARHCRYLIEIIHLKYLIHLHNHLYLIVRPKLNQ